MHPYETHMCQSSPTGLITHGNLREITLLSLGTICPYHKIIRRTLNMKKNLLILISLSLITASCSLMKNSLTLGVGTGIATRAIIGNSQGGSKQMLKGDAIGGLISGVGAYFIHGSLEKRDSTVRNKTLLNLEKYDVSTPSGYSTGGPVLTKPKRMMLTKISNMQYAICNTMESTKHKINLIIIFNKFTFI
jgi:hypothetical protein